MTYCGQGFGLGLFVRFGESSNQNHLNHASKKPKAPPLFVFLSLWGKQCAELIDQAKSQFVDWGDLKWAPEGYMALKVQRCALRS